MSGLVQAPPAPRLLLATLGAVAAGGALAARPTGVGALDVAWSALFVGILALFATPAPRLLLLSVAGAASLLAGTDGSLWLAVAAVVVAAIHAGQGQATPHWSAVTGGLVGLSLLTGSGLGGRLVEAATTTGLALVVVVGGLVATSARVRRGTLLAAGSLVLVLLVCAGAGVAAALQARGAVDRGIDAFRAAQRAGTAGDLEAAAAGFELAEAAFDDAGGPLGTLGRFGRAVPGLAQQLEAADAAVGAAGAAAQAASATMADLDLDAVGVRDGAVDLAAIRATQAPVGELVDVLVDTIERLEGLDRSLLAGPVSDALDDALEEARDAGSAVDRLHRALLVAPALLGEERPMRFLVLFTTPVEARGRTGFPGAYALLRLDQGRIGFEDGGAVDLANPDGGFDQLALQVPPRAQPYLSYGVSRDWRSVTLPPHGPAWGELAVQMAAQSRLGAIDGVVHASPEALATIVGLLGNVPLPSVGITLTERTTVDFLTREQYFTFPQLGQRQDRRDLLVDATAVVGLGLDRLSVPRARDLIDRFGPLIDAGHLTLSVPSSVAPDAADLLADTGVDGGFPAPEETDADVLLVAQRNTVGNKIDLFLHRDVAYEVSVDEDGIASTDLTIRLTNDAPGSGLPPYLIGSALRSPPPTGTNLSTTLVYSRYPLEELTLDGAVAVPPVFVEGGFHVYQVQVDLGPGQSRTIHARFRGPAVGEGQPYELVVYPGGLLTADRATVRLTDARSRTRVERELVVGAPSCVSLRQGERRCS